jgi:hypothetical protein
VRRDPGRWVVSTLIRTLSGVSIVTPGDWHEFDLSPATRHRSVASAVRRACAADVGLAGDAVQLISMLDGLVANAASAGGFYLAALAMRDSATGGIFAASVLMQLGPSLAGPAGSSAAEICAGLAGAISVDPSWAGASVEVVSLPVGPSVRVQVVAGGVMAQYIVPIRSRQLIVTFSSPCTPSMHYSDAALELFDAMAASVALVYDDE